MLPVNVNPFDYKTVPVGAVSQCEPFWQMLIFFYAGLLSSWTKIRLLKSANYFEQIILSDKKS